MAALTLLLALGLFTHHPADPSFSAPEAGRQAVQNWTGRLGSYLSSFLFESLGLASFWLVFILGHLTFFTFKRQARQASPSWYALGYLLLMVGSAAILSWDRGNFQFFGWNFPRGGVVGYLVFQQIKLYLNPPGAHILLVVMLLVGLILISRISLARMAERFQLWLYAQVGAWRDTYQKNRERRRKAKVLTVGKELQKERETKPPLIVQNPVVITPPASKVTPQQEQFVFMKDLGDYTLPPLVAAG